MTCERERVREMAPTTAGQGVGDFSAQFQQEASLIEWILTLDLIFTLLKNVLNKII